MRKVLPLSTALLLTLGSAGLAEDATRPKHEIIKRPDGSVVVIEGGLSTTTTSPFATASTDTAAMRRLKALVIGTDWNKAQEAYYHQHRAFPPSIQTLVDLRLLPYSLAKADGSAMPYVSEAGIPGSIYISYSDGRAQMQIYAEDGTPYEAWSGGDLATMAAEYDGPMGFGAGPVPLNARNYPADLETWRLKVHRDALQLRISSYIDTFRALPTDYSSMLAALGMVETSTIASGVTADGIPVVVAEVDPALGAYRVRTVPESGSAGALILTYQFSGGVVTRTLADPLVTDFNWQPFVTRTVE